MTLLSFGPDVGLQWLVALVDMGVGVVTAGSDGVVVVVVEV